MKGPFKSAVIGPNGMLRPIWRAAIFYAVGTLTGGVFAPLLFGWLIQTRSKSALLAGYLAAALLMIVGAIVELWLGVAAERRSLEHVAAPLSSR